MLFDRIFGAITFKKGIYKEVANDSTFTSYAWLIVLVVGMLNQIGTHAASISRGLIRWFIGGIILGVVAIGAFALSVFVISWLARSMFKSTATFDQVMRALGLAYIWRVVGFIGIVGAVTPLLLCVVAPIRAIVGIVGLVADLMAIKDSTGMDWTGTIVTVIVATVLTLGIIAIGGVILVALRVLI